MKFRITGLTRLVAAGAVTFSVLTLLGKNSYDSELRVATTKAKLDQLRDAAKTKALVADILWGTAIAGAAVTTVLIFTTDDSQERQPNARAQTNVAVAVTPTGMQLRGQF